MSALAWVPVIDANPEVAGCFPAPKIINLLYLSNSFIVLLFFYLDDIKGVQYTFPELLSEYSNVVIVHILLGLIIYVLSGLKILRTEKGFGSETPLCIQTDQIPFLKSNINFVIHI